MEKLWADYGFRGVAFLILALFTLLRVAQLVLQSRQLKREGLRANYVGQVVLGGALSFAALVFCVPELVGLRPEDLGLVHEDGGVAAIASAARAPRLPRVRFDGPLAPARDAILKEDWRALASVLFEVRRKGTAPETDTSLLLTEYRKHLAKEYLDLAKAELAKKEKGDVALARQYLFYPIELAPEEPEAFYLRATLTPREQWESALADLEIAIRRAKPGDLRAYDARLAIRLERDPRSALPDLDVLLTARPGDVALLARRGTLRVALGAIDGGIADLTSAARAAPADVKVRVELAKARLAKGDDANVKLAADELDRAIKEAPDDFESVYARAQARFVLRRLPEALSDASRAIQLSPQSSDAYCLRARIVTDLDRVIQGRKDFDEAIRLDPKNRKAYFWRGFLSRERDPKGALADFTRAVELEPDGWANYYRGECLLTLNRRDDAETALSEALALANDERLVKLIQNALTRARRKR